MLRAISQNNTSKSIPDDDPIDIELKDVVAMIIAVFHILMPVLILGGMIIAGMYLSFYLIVN